jgi:hypothetical protein
MRIEEYRGFQIHIYSKDEGFFAEIHRKDKLMHTVKDPDELSGLYGSSPLAFEAAKDWIDKTYPKKMVGYVDGT